MCIGQTVESKRTVDSLPLRHFHRMVWSSYWTHFPGISNLLSISKICVLSWILKLEVPGLLITSLADAPPSLGCNFWVIENCFWAPLEPTLCLCWWRTNRAMWSTSLINPPAVSPPTPISLKMFHGCNACDNCISWMLIFPWPFQICME